MRVYYVQASDGAIHELGYNPGPGWSAGPAFTPPVAAGTSPTSFQYGTAGAARVYYVQASDGAIHELGYNPGPGWGVSGPQTPAVAPGASPVAFEFGSGSAAVYYEGADHAAHDLGYTLQGGWTVSGPLTSQMAPGTGLAGFAYRSADTRVYFVDAADDEIHELAYDPDAGWVVNPPVAATTSPVPTTVVPPPNKPRARPRVRVKLTIGWTWNRRGTRIRSVRTSGFPSRGRITLRCTGRGCPWRVQHSGRRGLKRLWRRLERYLYLPGQRMTLTITEPGHVAERAVLRIRDARVPAVRLL